MKATSLIILTCALVLGLPLSTTAQEAGRFKTLAEATKALDSALVAPDPLAALNVLLNGRKSYLSDHPEVVAMLLKEHKRTGEFAILYAGRNFPGNGDTFKLGGHASELGHVHIDFSRADGEWMLKDIWNCR